MVNATLKEPKNNIPGVFQACSLSRTEALKKYHRCEMNTGLSNPPYAYFINYDIDTLVLESPTGDQPYKREMIDAHKYHTVPLNNFQLRQWETLDKDRLQRLLVSEGFWKWTLDRDTADLEFMEKISDLFPNLEETLFELDDYDDPTNRDASNRYEVTLGRISSIRNEIYRVGWGRWKNPYCFAVVPGVVDYVPEPYDLNDVLYIAAYHGVI